MARITAVIREAVECGREEDGEADKRAQADSETGEDRGRRACCGGALTGGPEMSAAWDASSRGMWKLGCGESALLGRGRAGERTGPLRWTWAAWEGGPTGPSEGLLGRHREGERSAGWTGWAAGLGLVLGLFSFSISFSFSN